MRLNILLIGVSSFLLVSASGCQPSAPRVNPSRFKDEPVSTSSPVVASTPISPDLMSPAAGAVMDNGRKDTLDDLVWEFEWSPCEGAERYNLLVKHEYAINIFIDDESLTSCQYTYTGRTCVPPGNDRNWTWRVRAMVGGKWGPWSETRTFDVEPVDTDDPIYPPTVTPTPKIINYNVTVSIMPDERYGKVYLDPPGGKYPAGSQITLTVEANDGYKFVEWGGDLGGPITIMTIIVGSDMNITAHFVAGSW